MEIIYFHGPVTQPVFREYADRVHFVKGKDSELLTKEALSKMHNKLIILDDCYSDICEKDLIRFLYTTLSHHNSLGCLMLLHNLYSQSIAMLREIILNSNLFAFTFSPANKSMLKTWAIQFFPEKWRSVLSILDHCFNESRFGYCTFDFSPFKNDRFRISNNLTPEEGDRCFYLFKDN